MLTANVLIIDDDEELCEMVAEYLSMEGFTCESWHHGMDAADKISTGDYQALILDVMLPYKSGFEILKEVRAVTNIPVLMLTARGEDIDRIIGLELGADDYLPKPFNPRELVARIKAVLRRTRHDHAPQAMELKLGELSLQTSSRKVTLEEQEVELTSSQFNLLKVLLTSSGQVVTKEVLSLEALGKPLTAYDRSIDMHISHLRKKLGTGKGIQIHTERGIGYKIIKES